MPPEDYYPANETRDWAAYDEWPQRMQPKPIDYLGLGFERVKQGLRAAISMMEITPREDGEVSKIQRIKAVRDAATGYNLREAKEIVDWMDRVNLKVPHVSMTNAEFQTELKADLKGCRELLERARDELLLERKKNHSLLETLRLTETLLDTKISREGLSRTIRHCRLLISDCLRGEL